MIPHGATSVGVEATKWNALIEILELSACVRDARDCFYYLLAA